MAVIFNISCGKKKIVILPTWEKMQGSYSVYSSLNNTYISHEIVFWNVFFFSLWNNPAGAFSRVGPACVTTPSALVGCQMFDDLNSVTATCWTFTTQFFSFIYLLLYVCISTRTCSLYIYIYIYCLCYHVFGCNAYDDWDSVTATCWALAKLFFSLFPSLSVILPLFVSIDLFVFLSLSPSFFLSLNSLYFVLSTCFLFPFRYTSFFL